MAATLVTYRRWGGYAGLSQHMAVGEDGMVTLSDRKTRKRTSIQADPSEIEEVRALIDAIPAERWHGLAGALLRRALPNPHEAMRFQIQAGQRRVGGASGSTEADLGPLLAKLDDLLARAVREGRP
jgi:hypothetical protein